MGCFLKILTLFQIECQIGCLKFICGTDLRQPIGHFFWNTWESIRWSQNIVCFSCLYTKLWVQMSHVGILESFIGFSLIHHEIFVENETMFDPLNVPSVKKRHFGWRAKTLKSQNSSSRLCFGQNHLGWVTNQV